MRRRNFEAALVVLVMGASSAGCTGDVCAYLPRVCDDGAGGDGGSVAGGNGAGGGVGGTGGEGGNPIPPGCEPTEGEPIGTNCGVYVETGGDGNGSFGDPFGTLTEAVTELGNNTRIYVCGGDTFTGSFALPPGVSIYGSLSCGDWVYRVTNPRPTLVGNQNVPAITIDGGTATLKALQIIAPDADGFDLDTLQGNSSIALWVSAAAMTLEDVTVVAGNGEPGQDGLDQSGQAAGGAAFNGNPGFGCGALSGGAEKVMACNGIPTTGGKGGAGGMGIGSSGDPGTPNYGGTPTGAGGLGDNGAGLPTDWSCGSDFGNAQGGEDAPPVVAAAAGTGIGTLVGTSYLGDDGDDGEDGGPGQGGGGGGGRRGDGDNTCGAGVVGPSGGGGGAGGCGGLGGEGGGAGGASIGIVSLGAAWTFTGVSISAGNGGAGGAGGNSQLGGNGSSGGGPGAGNACSGGPGGAGASGAPGGGGRGGPSLGIAYTGEVPGLGEGAISVAAAGSSGGAGGTPGGNAGAPGLFVPKQPFD